MSELDKLLNDAVEYIKLMLYERYQAKEDLLRLRDAGQEPNVFHVLDPDIGLLIRFQGVPVEHA